MDTLHGTPTKLKMNGVFQTSNKITIGNKPYGVSPLGFEPEMNPILFSSKIPSSYLATSHTIREGWELLKSDQTRGVLFFGFWFKNASLKCDAFLRTGSKMFHPCI
jgi:hypothetical protein